MTLHPSLTPLSLPGSRVRVVFSPGALNHLGAAAKAEGATRVLLITDPGIVEAGHAERSVRSLYQAGLVVRVFDEVEENPTTEHVNQGLALAKQFKPDFLI